MAIGLLVIATIGLAYVGASQSFKTQNALASIQENARYAFEFLGIDIRMAGFNGGPSDQDIIQPVGWVNERDLQNSPLVGYEEDVSTFPTSITTGTRPRLRGDAITIVHIDTNSEYPVSAAPSATTFTLTSWPNPAPQVGGLFVGADYTHAAAFAVSAVDSGAKTMTTTDALGSFTGSFSALRVYPLSGATYYIANNPVDEPSLYRLRLTSTGGTLAEELVEGVHDLQISYGVDYSAPTAASDIIAAAWSSNRITFTSTGHGLAAYDWVNITGVTPAGYNGYYKVASTPDADTFTVDQTTNPGSYTVGGSVKKAADQSVDDYWTANQVNLGTDGTATIPGPATTKNYWAHVLSVRCNVTLTTRSDEHVSTTGGLLTKSFTTTFAVRNRL